MSGANVNFFYIFWVPDFLLNFLLAFQIIDLTVNYANLHSKCLPVCMLILPQLFCVRCEYIKAEPQNL